MKTFGGVKFNEQYKAVHREGCDGIQIVGAIIKGRWYAYPLFCECPLGRKAKKVANKTGFFAPLDTHKDIQRFEQS